jgi:uncharacterized protein
MGKSLQEIIALKLGIHETNVTNTIQLLEEGASVPFISRYRKERTGSLDEVLIDAIKNEYDRLENLVKRKLSILKTIEEQNLLTSELKDRINNCFDSIELEDIYLPYKPKKRTRASIAREKGLEPLAKIIFKQRETDIRTRSLDYINDKIETVEEALTGARDIIAEWINENDKARMIVRRSFDYGAMIFAKVIKGKEEIGVKFNDYFDWTEPLKKCPSHRLLAMRRGENEGILRVSIFPEENETIDKLKRHFVLIHNSCGQQMDCIH